jgi:hypothetical protein
MMMTRTWVALGALLACAGACSSGGSSTVRDAGSGGADGAGSPPAKAGLAVTLSGGACLVAGTTALPEPPLAAPSDIEIGDSLVDNTNGDEVTCAVSPADQGFEITAHVVHGTTGLTLTATTDGSGTGTGQVTLVTAQTSLSSDSVSPCTFTGLQLLAGAFWGQFSCAAVSDPASPDSTCTADGVVTLENCAR